MEDTIDSLQQDQLGSDATDATVAQFKRACRAAIEQHPGIWNYDDDGVLIESEVVDYVWNDGQFDVSIRQLLNEEVAF